MTTDTTAYEFQDTYEDRRLEAMWALAKVISILNDMADDDADETGIVCFALVAQLRKVGAFMDRLPDGVALLAPSDDEVAE